VKQQWIRHVEGIADHLYPTWREHFARTGKRLPAAVRKELNYRADFEAHSEEFAGGLLDWLGAKSEPNLMSDMSVRLDAVLRLTAFVVSQFLEGNYSLEKNDSEDGLGGRRQPSRGGTSRVTGDGQARICERLGAKFPGPTRQEETAPCQTGLRRPGENLTNRHREANVTAPLLDSTQNALFWAKKRRKLVRTLLTTTVSTKHRGTRRTPPQRRRLRAAKRQANAPREHGCLLLQSSQFCLALQRMTQLSSAPK